MSSMVPLILLFSAAGLAFFLLPVHALVRCSQDKGLSDGGRLGWLSCIVVLWPVGGVVYGVLRSPSGFARLVHLCGGLSLISPVLGVGMLLAKAEQASLDQLQDLSAQLHELEDSGGALPADAAMAQVLLAELQDEVRGQWFPWAGPRAEATVLTAHLQAVLNDDQLSSAELTGWRDLRRYRGDPEAMQLASDATLAMPGIEQRAPRQPRTVTGIGGSTRSGALLETLHTSQTPSVALGAVQRHALKVFGGAGAARTDGPVAGQEAAALRAQDSVQLLIELLGHDEAQVRAQAADVLWIVGAPAAKEALRAALSDREPRVRGFAACALGGLGDDEAMVDLIALLSDDDEGVRARAASALGVIGDERALIAVQRMVERHPEMQSNGFVRKALNALGG